jgi:hypothetical protein
MPTLTTLGGWAFLFVGGALYYQFVIRKTADKNRRAAALKQPSKLIDSQKEPKARKSRKDEGLSSGDQDVLPTEKVQKKKNQRGPKETQSYSPIADRGIDDEDELNNREFARQLSNAKAGTIVAAKSQTATRQKSVKQSRAQERPAFETSSDNATAPSSATGGDADDDQSSVNSPDLGATTMVSPVTNGDIADMLEAPASGPSILRIIEPTTPSRPKKAKPQPTFEVAETKKQRQNRKKNELKRLVREEEEKERKIREEQQRRTARIAEGRAAKDGSTFMAAKEPSTSAWTPPTAVDGSKNVDTKVDLLDTYEPSSSKPSTAVPAEALYSESEQVGSDWQKLAPNFPSEEEQMRFAIENSDNWKTVKSKEKRKNTKKAGQKEDKQSSTDEQEYGVPPVITPTGPGKKWDMTLVHVESNGEVVEREKEVQDSEWEVA